MGTLEKGVKYVFKLNNKNTRTTSVFLLWTLDIFHFFLVFLLLTNKAFLALLKVLRKNKHDDL